MTKALITPTNLCFSGMKVVIAAGTRSVEDPALADRLNVAGDAQREGKFEAADTILRQMLADYAHEALPVDVLCPLTIRALEVLYHYDVTTVADLIRCELFDLRSWYNFGMISRTLLGKRMQSLELNLTKQRDYNWIKPDELIKRRQQRLDRLLLLPPFSLPGVCDPALCGVPLVFNDRAFYPRTQLCALPRGHQDPFHLSAQHISDGYRGMTDHPVSFEDL